MGEESESGAESDANMENSSSEEQETSGITEYEKQRLERIKENKARLEALGLPALASSLLSTLQKKNKGKAKKGKQKKAEDDDEYKPSDAEERGSSSNEEQDWSDADASPPPPPPSTKGKRPQSLKKNQLKSKPSAKKHARKLDFVDDEEALQQAIALSLADSSDVMGVVHPRSTEKCSADVAAMGLQERKGRAPVQEVDKRKKNRRSNTSRMQINEDLVIIHFFQFDAPAEAQLSLCRYCGKIMEGRCRTRLMQHLAGNSSDIAACECVPTHVKEEMREHLSRTDGLQSHKRVNYGKQSQTMQPHEDEVEDPELKLEQDIEEAMKRSMNDPEFKEIEEIKIATLESQRINPQVLGGACSSRTCSAIIVEDSDEELDRLLRFDGEDDDDGYN